MMNRVVPRMPDVGRTVQQQKKWVEPAARAGFAAKGAVYVVLGVLSVMAAAGVSGGKTSGPSEAIYEIGTQSFGQILLVLLAIGLFGYALWRFIQAGLDPEHEGTDAKGIAKRVGFALSGVAHVALAIAAIQLIDGGGGGSASKTWLSAALGETWGQYLIGALGLFLMGVGLYQLKRAYTLEFRRELKTNEMSQKEIKAATITGRAGLAARGVVFPIMGYFFILAAVEANPSQAKDVGGVLDKIAEAGAIPLAIIAIGLCAYGLFQIIMARYRAIHVR